jgi:hypothetical protein
MPIQRGCRRCPAWCKSAVLQSGAALLELSRPGCGIVVGYSPAGCEVCKERPAVARAQPWVKTEPRHSLTHERNSDEKLACEIPPHVRPDIWAQAI